MDPWYGDTVEVRLEILLLPNYVQCSTVSIAMIYLDTRRVPVEGKPSVCLICMKYRIIFLIIIIQPGSNIIIAYSALNIKLLEPLAQGASRFEKLLAPPKIHWPPFFSNDVKVE